MPPRAARDFGSTKYLELALPSPTFSMCAMIGACHLLESVAGQAIILPLLVTWAVGPMSDHLAADVRRDLDLIEVERCDLSGFFSKWCK